MWAESFEFYNWKYFTFIRKSNLIFFDDFSLLRDLSSEITPELKLASYVTLLSLFFLSKLNFLSTAFCGAKDRSHFFPPRTGGAWRPLCYYPSVGQNRDRKTTERHKTIKRKENVNKTCFHSLHTHTCIQRIVMTHTLSLSYTHTPTHTHTHTLCSLYPTHNLWNLILFCVLYLCVCLGVCVCLSLPLSVFALKFSLT